MKRAEFFVARGRGHYAKCRVPFRCECLLPTALGTVQCSEMVHKGDTYLATDIARYDQSLYKPWLHHFAHAKRRYCMRCSLLTID